MATHVFLKLITFKTVLSFLTLKVLPENPLSAITPPAKGTFNISPETTFQKRTDLSMEVEI